MFILGGQKSRYLCSNSIYRLSSEIPPRPTVETHPRSHGVLIVHHWIKVSSQTLARTLISRCSPSIGHIADSTFESSEPSSFSLFWEHFQKFENSNFAGLSLGLIPSALVPRLFPICTQNRNSFFLLEITNSLFHSFSIPRFHFVSPLLSNSLSDFRKAE
jgi:hypothetical protein